MNALGVPGPRASRQEIEEWVASFAELYSVVDEVIGSVEALLGAPRLRHEPRFSRFDAEGSKVSCGAVWFPGGSNRGFHLEVFGRWGRVEAWANDLHRSASLRVGHLDPSQLVIDFRYVIAAARVTNLTGLR